MSEPVRFLFGVHNHQPSGNFESVILEAARRRGIGGAAFDAHLDVAALESAQETNGNLRRRGDLAMEKGDHGRWN